MSQSKSSPKKRTNPNSKSKHSDTPKKRIPVKGFVEVPEDERPDLHVGTGGLRDSKGLAALAHLEEDNSCTQEEEKRQQLLEELDRIKQSRSEAKDLKNAEAYRLLGQLLEFFIEHPEAAHWVWNRVKDVCKGIKKGASYISTKISKKKSTKSAPCRPSTATDNASNDTLIILAIIHQYRQIPEVEPSTMIPIFKEMLSRHPEAAENPMVQAEFAAYQRGEVIEKEPLSESIVDSSDREKSINYDEELMKALGL